MQQAGDAYAGCLAQHANADVKSTAPAEELALAAHGSCWPVWDAYRESVRSNFFFDARTPEEKQLANDRTVAHLRDFEQEARRGLIDSMIERTLKSGTADK
jgi:hypothetical protein